MQRRIWLAAEAFPPLPDVASIPQPPRSRSRCQRTGGCNQCRGRIACEQHGASPPGHMRPGTPFLSAAASASNKSTVFRLRPATSDRLTLAAALFAVARSADCHWQAQPDRPAALGATTEKARNLRVFQTSLSSTTAFAVGSVSETRRDYSRPPHPTRLPPSRSILMSLGNTDPIELTGPVLPSVILPIGSLSVVETLVGTEAQKSDLRVRPALRGVKQISYPPGRIANILSGRIGDCYDGPP